MKKVLIGLLVLSSAFLFAGCKKSNSLNSLHYEEWEGEYKVYHLFTDKEITGDVVIPMTYNDKPVTIIPKWGFLDCTKMTSITLTENILTIASAAFENCTSLKFNEYENGYYLGTSTNPYYAFVKPIDANVETVTINSNCAVIAGDAFYDNDSITHIELPDSVKSINADSFYSCSKLETIKMPKEMKYISGTAISNCNALKGLIIPEGIKAVTMAVLSCSSMEYIVLPSTLESVYLVSINDSINIFYNGNAETLLALEGIPSWITVDNTYSYSETMPTESGNFWHYDAENNPIVWVYFY